MGWLIIGLLGIWLVITLICQIPWSMAKRVRSFDVFALVPTWSFFAPNPAVHDFTLIFRYFVGSTPGPWQVWGYSLPTPLTRWLWNPLMRRSKVVHDMATVWLHLESSGKSPNQRLLAVPYLCLLRAAAELPRSADVGKIQIAIASVRAGSPSEPALVFATSSVHRLDAAHRP